MCSMNKMSWIKVCIWKVSTNSLLSTTIQFRQWSDKCSVFFNLLNENKNHNVNSEYSNKCSTQIKRTSKTDKKEKQYNSKCTV